MTKQLYVVTTEIEHVVLADNEQEARKIAANVDSFDLNIGHEMHWTAQPMRYFPGDWDGDALPYGKDDEGQERTVKQLIDAGHAPEYTKHFEEMQKRLGNG
jgi:hypothetical protein